MSPRVLNVRVRVQITIHYILEFNFTNWVLYQFGVILFDKPISENFWLIMLKFSWANFDKLQQHNKAEVM